VRLSYANVAATAALVFCAVGTAVASSGIGTSGSISKVCADSSGNLSLPTGTGACRKHGHLRRIAGATGAMGAAGATGATGPQGPAGSAGAAGSPGPPGASASLTQLTSPNGKFTVTVTNAGIQLTGPETSLELSAHDLTMLAGESTSLTSGTSTSLLTGTNLSLEAGATALLAGEEADVLGNSAAVLGSPKVSLGGTSGCSPVARRGDTIQGGSIISSGSSIVSSC